MDNKGVKIEIKFGENNMILAKFSKGETYMEDSTYACNFSEEWLSERLEDFITLLENTDSKEIDIYG